MSEASKDLDEKRMRAAESLKEIALRDGSAENDEAYRKANEDYDRLTERVTSLRKIEGDDAARALELEERKASMADAAREAGLQGGTPEEGDNGDKAVKSWRDMAREAIKGQSRTKGGTFEDLPDAENWRTTTRNMVASTGQERRQERREMERYERRTAATLAKGTATSGPELVKDTLVTNLFSKLFDDSAVLSSGVTILRTATGEQIKFPRLTALGQMSQSNARVAESGAILFSEPNFDQVELDAYKYAQASKATREIIEDSVIDIQGILGTVLGRNMANYLGIDLLNGDGSGKPRGITTIAANNVVTGATGQTGGLGGTEDEFSKLMDLVYKLKPGYRRNAKFLVNDLTTLALRKIKVNYTTGANTFAWTPGIGGGPDTLLGYPVLVDPFMAGVGLSALSIVFADFEMYNVRLVNGVRVEWSTEYAWDTDEVAVKAVLRADGDAIDDLAFAGFVGGAS